MSVENGRENSGHDEREREGKGREIVAKTTRRTFRVTRNGQSREGANNLCAQLGGGGGV